MKLPTPSDINDLCDRCVALCCRYYCFPIEKPDTKRDFDDIRWYLLHEDCFIFVEDGDWYIQINRKCKALLPNNQCAIYENRPSICRQYNTKDCDWHGDEYDYDRVFAEPEQIERFAKEHLTNKRKRRAAARKRTDSQPAVPKKRPKKRSTTRKVRIPLRLLKTA